MEELLGRLNKKIKHLDDLADAETNQSSFESLAAIRATGAMLAATLDDILKNRVAGEQSVKDSIAEDIVEFCDLVEITLHNK